MEPQPQVSSIVPCVALVINLADSSEEQAEAGARFFAPLLGRLELPATWVIDRPPTAEVLADGQFAAVVHELAVSVEARSPQRLRSELSNLQTAVQAVSGHGVSVILGDPQQLRARTTLLADLRIEAVIAGTQQPGPAKPPRQLPCGLWQFDPAMNVPQPRHRWSWLTTRRPSLKQLMDSETSGDKKVLAIHVAQANDRDLQSSEQLLSEIADACGQQQLRVATVRALASELVSQREVKPQRSILRRAA